MKIPLILVLSTTLCGACWAQTAGDAGATAQPAEAVKTYRILLKNVKPSVVAYWLDPTHHTMPTESSVLSIPRGPELKEDDAATGQLFLLAGQVAPKDTSQQQEPTEPKTFALPMGVEQIVAIDTQNTLLVRGTKEGVTKLFETIQFLDKPLRQVEIEARLVTVDAAAGALRIPNPPTADGLQSFGFLRADAEFKANLDALQKQGKATVVSLPSVVATNNFQTTVATPLNSQEAAQRRLLQVTPSINNDDTVTLLAHFEEGSSASPAQKATSGTKLKPGIEFIANAHDGETIATQIGLTTNPNKVILLLITPHIVK